MSQHGFYFDAERCFGCGSCVIACKELNDTPAGDLVYWRRVTTTESGRYPHLRLDNQSRSCMHCGQPACEKFCPAHAISKRSQDGVVAVDRSKCTGCRTCETACPFGVPRYGHDGKMQKCDFCTDPARGTAQPECAAACLGGALLAGPLDQLARIQAKKAPIMMAGDTQPSVLVPK
jgi:anaerobic dimethyl sulfoxide reductase subunit B